MVSDISAERCRECIQEIILNWFKAIFLGCGASVFIVMTGPHYIIVMAVFYRIADWRRSQSLDQDVGPMNTNSQEGSRVLRDF